MSSSASERVGARRSACEATCKNMLGRCFDGVGDERFMLPINTDLANAPYHGPIKTHFLNNYTLAVIDPNREVHVQSLAGNGYSHSYLD